MTSCSLSCFGVVQDDGGGQQLEGDDGERVIVAGRRSWLAPSCADQGRFNLIPDY